MSTHLEDIEQKTLHYLMHVTNPVVAIEVLHAHLRDNELATDMATAELKQFLAAHELFRVMEPVMSLEDIAPTDSADLSPHAYVILDTRVPTDQQLAVMMLDQLTTLESALRTAREQALNSNDEDTGKQIDEALRNAIELRHKLAPHGADPNNAAGDGSTPPADIVHFPH